MPSLGAPETAGRSQSAAISDGGIPRRTRTFWLRSLDDGMGEVEKTGLGYKVARESGRQ